MAEDWSIDVKKYAPDADDGIIAGIVRHCGIALHKVDSSLVAFSDKEETDRVRESFLKKKLGLTDPDSELDRAIAGVGERMKADRTKNRVTVYYLLAEHFGKLGLFARPAMATGSEAGTPAAATVATGDAVAPADVSQAAGATVAGAAALGAAGLAGAADLGSRVSGGGHAAPAEAMTSAPAGVSGYGGAANDGTAAAGGGLMRWLPWLLLAAGILALLWYFLVRRPAATTPPAATVAASVPVAPPPVAAPTSAAIPTGAGVTTETLNGKPGVSVYFDTGKAVVVSAFIPAAATLKTYLDANAGSKLAVSGYNDKTGSAALNAKLSKNRAEAVQSALIRAGIPAAAIELVKPADTTDTGTSNAQARRVDVTIE